MTAAVLAGAIAAAAGLIVPTAQAATDRTTPADIIHPNVHDKVGQGNDGTNKNANPEGNSGIGSTGGAIHGIGNTPGQNDAVSASDGDAGFKDQLDSVHGGWSDWKANKQDTLVP